MVIIVLKIGKFKSHWNYKCRDVYNVRFYKFPSKMFEFPQFFSHESSEVISLVS